MHGTQRDLQRNAPSHRQGDDDVNEESDQNKEVYLMRMPAKLFGKSIRVAGTPTADAIRRQHGIMPSNQ
jgi:hypothetical protein